MKKQIVSATLSILLFCNFTAQAEIYRWVDEQTGAVVYSDQPGKNAKPVKIRGSSHYDSRAVAQSQVPKEQNTPPLYSSLTIITPTNDSTVRDNTGNVPVSLGLSPTLQKGHSVVLTFDGADIPLPSTRFIIKDVERGTHKLIAKVMDKDGKVLISSKVSQFHMKRHSALFKKAK